MTQMAMYGYAMIALTFQYRKRYEVTCDNSYHDEGIISDEAFQYRKRYEVTCDISLPSMYLRLQAVSIPQAV